MVVEYGHGPDAVLDAPKPYQCHILLLTLNQYMDLHYSTALTKQISKLKLRTEFFLHVRDVQGVRRRVDGNGLLAPEPEELLVINHCLGVLAGTLLKLLFTGVAQPQQRPE